MDLSIQQRSQEPSGRARTPGATCAYPLTHPHSRRTFFWDPAVTRVEGWCREPLQTAIFAHPIANANENHPCAPSGATPTRRVRALTDACRPSLNPPPPGEEKGGFGTPDGVTKEPNSDRKKQTFGPGRPVGRRRRRNFRSQRSSPSRRWRTNNRGGRRESSGRGKRGDVNIDLEVALVSAMPL